MAKPFYPTNDGHVGNLEKLSTLQLHDLVKRQKDLMKKRAFLNKLPDKGQKIREHLEILLKELSKREEPNTESKVKSNSEEIEHHLKPNINGLQSKGQTVENNDSLSVSPQMNNPLTEKMDWENALNRLTLNDNELRGVEGNSGKFKHQYELAMERAEENVKSSNKKPFHLNRTLKIEKVKDLPEDIQKTKGQRNTESHKNRQIHHDTELSAAMPPSYKYTAAKPIALQESLQLQRKQKQVQEELNAQLAAEKLASRLHIKLEKYNPEGVDMSYRGNPEIDSDDEDDNVIIGETSDAEDGLIPSDTED